MAINFNQVGFTYQLNTPFATQGLHDVNFTMPEGKFTAVIGHTGSGKSTMVQHLDGLVIPTAGEITIAEQRIVPTTKPKELNKMRAHVGLVFQFPEAQLFEQTVLKDVMFGPKNFGKTATEAEAAAKRAIELGDAMEARGYRGGDNRTKYRVLTWQKQDTIAVIGFIVFTVLLIATKWL